jgi:hypothetical protein
MKPRAMDSLDDVETVMLVEEIFGTDVPNDDAEQFGSPQEIVDWLEINLSNRRPNKQAVPLLRKLAKTQQRPELAEGSDWTWRREHIAAIIREIFR